MKAVFLEMLCCPRCRGGFSLMSAVAGADAEVLSGALACAGCGARFPIEEGVPNLVADEVAAAPVKRSFEFQWLYRLSGRAEPPSVCYGFDTRKFAAWLNDQFGDVLGEVVCGWSLDAGCGSAEKAAELALLHPDHRFVAADLSRSIMKSAAIARAIPNLQFVRADVTRPPFRPGSFDLVFSIGVLHHTPDTEAAFRSVASLVRPGGRLLTWIYPAPGEDPFWSWLYRQRDKHFLGLAHRLPLPVTLWWIRAYSLLLYPRLARFLSQQFLANRLQYPIYPDNVGLRQLYRTIVFLTLDNVAPACQDRRSAAEVLEWYLRSGFARPDICERGFQSARRRRAEPVREST